MTKCIGMIFTVFFIQAAHAGEWIRFDDTDYCKGSGQFAYKYNYLWNEGGWGPVDLTILGLTVVDLSTQRKTYFTYSSQLTHEHGIGLVFVNSEAASLMKKYLIVDNDQFSGRIGFSEALSRQALDIANFDSTIVYRISATYQPWIHCN